MSARPRTRPADVLAQATLAVAGRRGRSLLTAAGVGLGVAAVVATIGVSATAGGAISDRFDALQATLVTVRYPNEVPRPPADTAAVAALNGVAAAGLTCAGTGEVGVARHPDEPSPVRLNVIAAQPEALRALGVDLVAGRMFDQGHGARGDRVALIDTVAARELGMIDATSGMTLWLDDGGFGGAYTVVGMFAAPTGDVRLTAAVVVPYETCLTEAAGLFAPPDLVIRTHLGAADQVGREAPLAMLPEAPQLLTALVPPDLRTFRRGVEAETQALFFGLAAVSLVIGALGISNLTLVSVLERRAEIGLRRAVGASRRAVAAQFLVESGLVGLAGGLLGTVVGIDITAAVALVQDWIVLLDPGLAALGPLTGATVGMLAGLHPAWRAARMAPAATLRGE